MKENPSSLRSKSMLSQSLHKLLLIKPYEKITIKEITEHAELARMTFYTNFKEKDDLFVYICKEELSEFKNTLKVYDKLDKYILAYGFFEFFRERQNFIKSLTLHSVQIFKAQTELNIMEIVRENHLLPVLQTEENLQKYEWIFMAGGLLNMTIHWVRTDCVESSEEMANVFMALVKHS